MNKKIITSQSSNPKAKTHQILHRVSKYSTKQKTQKFLSISWFSRPPNRPTSIITINEIFFFEKLTLVEGSGEANVGGIFGFGSLQRGVVETSQDSQRTRPWGPEAPWSRSHLVDRLRSPLADRPRSRLVDRPRSRLADRPRARFSGGERDLEKRKGRIT